MRGGACVLIIICRLERERERERDREREREREEGKLVESERKRQGTRKGRVH